MSNDMGRAFCVASLYIYCGVVNKSNDVEVVCLTENDAISYIAEKERQQSESLQTWYQDPHGYYEWSYYEVDLYSRGETERG